MSAFSTEQVADLATAVRGRDMQGAPLEHLVIVQITRGIAGEVAGAMLGDHGAVVVVAEPANGSDLRRSAVDVEQRTSLLFRSEARGKLSVALNFDSDEGRRALRDLVLSADAVIEDLGPGRLESLGLVPADLQQVRPDLCILRISPFGQFGPLRDAEGDDRVAQAFGGVAHVTGYIDTPPMHVATPIADYTTGVHGASGLLLALLNRAAGGQVVDLALYETVFRIQEEAVIQYDQLGIVRERMGNEYAETVPSNHFHTSDDHWVAISAASVPSFSTVCRAIDAAGRESDPLFATDEARRINRDAVNELIQSWIGSHTLAEVLEAFRREGAPIAQVRSIDEILADEHSRVTRMIDEVPDEDDQTLLVPGAAPRLSGAGPRALGAPPRYGEHTDLVLRLLGERADIRSGASTGSAARPLQGLKVLDLGRYIAGPFAATLLAEFGADVVKMEGIGGDTTRSRYPMVGDIGLSFIVTNRGKKTICLDLKTPEGMSVLRDLVAWADVVVENFRPGTLEKWGLGADVLAEMNPNLIMLRASGFGQSGPDAPLPAFDRIGLAAGGMSYVGGLSHRPPLRPGVLLSDYSTGLFGFFGVLAMLWGIEHGAQGGVVDASLVGSISRMLGDTPAMRTVDGVVRERDDARWSGYEYSLSGHDESGRAFVCSARSADRAGAALAAIGAAAEASPSPARFAEAVRAWAVQRSVKQIVPALREAGLGAAPTRSIEEIVDSEHMLARENIVRVPHDGLGSIRMQGIVPRLERTPGVVLATSPSPGAEVRVVLSECLGYDSDTVASLVGSKGVGHGEVPA